MAFAEGIEKTGFRCFEFCERRESPILHGWKRLRGEAMWLAGPKDGALAYSE